MRRALRRLLPALPLLAVSALVLGAATMTIFSTSMLMTVTHEIQEMRWPLRLGPRTVEAVFPVVWLLATALLGLWLGCIHARAPVRAALLWVMAVLALIAVVTLVGRVAIAFLPVEGMPPAGDWPPRLPALIGLVLLATVPIAALARIGAVVTRRSARHRPAAQLAKARRRRERRRAATGSAPSAATETRT